MSGEWLSGCDGKMRTHYNLQGMRGSGVCVAWWNNDVVQVIVEIRHRG